jgi:hypothetical protein
MNPTGTLLPDSFLKEIASLGVPVISDEIYHGLVYDGKARSILEFTDKAFVVTDFPNVLPRPVFVWVILLRPSPHAALQTLQQNLFSVLRLWPRHAGIAALREAAPMWRICVASTMSDDCT